MNFLPRALIVTAVNLPLAAAIAAEPTYSDDVAFLRRHVDVVELVSDDGDNRVVVVPDYQGRVMTSSAGGPSGHSFGWINRELIESGELRRQINVFGGEDRFWLGPEGGPYSLFFAKSAPAQTFEHWQTPAFLDTEPWKMVHKSKHAVEFTATQELVNRAGTPLQVKVKRVVRLTDPAGLIAGGKLPTGIRAVGFESVNHLTNAGREAWTKSTGLPSIWILGMFRHGPRTVAVIPLRPSKGDRHAGVRSDYFGEIPPDRLKVGPNVLLLRADGKSRGKVGVAANRATPFCGSWDAERGVLTIVQFTLPANAEERPYVDSRWIDMKDPYAGDVINAYNDGPPAPGAKALGPFYELESSSPAAALKPGKTIVHTHRTYHFAGPREDLDRLSRELLKIGLDEIERAFAETRNAALGW